MKATSITLTAILFLIIGSYGFSQEVPCSPKTSTFAMIETGSGESPGDQNDPGYKTYKAGYDLILGEKWKEARKKFAELISKYPKSEYVDDAEYWSAYALKHLDEKKAVEAYDKFISTYPNSQYYDDAVADLSQLKDETETVYSGTGGTNIHVKVGERALVTPEGMVVGKANGRLLGYNFGRNMHRLQRQLRGLAIAAPRPTPQPWGIYSSDEKLDPETKLKMDALYAIGETKEDSTSYKALRDVALDRSQPHQLREAAMDALSDFRKFDVLPIFTEVAKTDTSEYMQNTAIEFVGQHSKDKNRSVETLMELFSAIPQYREEQLGTVLYSIAEIGNDKAVDFLAKVAQTNENYNLRSDAVYYLGNIGSEKARAALYEILKAK
jgi:tetratricopeptide (TPR) repeat protein